MNRSLYQFILTAVFVCGAFAAQAQVVLPKLPEPERFYKVPEHTPAWLEGHQSLLPTVDKATVEEMANALNYMRMIGKGVSPEYAKYEDAARKARRWAGELKEKAAYAILALYTHEDPNILVTDDMRGQIVDAILRDPTILEYTLPFFRQRVNYLVEQFRAGNTRTPDDTPVASAELDVLVGYLHAWGDESDKKSLRELLELMRAKGDYYVGGWATEALQIFEQEVAAETAEYSRKKNIHKVHFKTSDYLAHGLDVAYALPSSTYKPSPKAPSANTPNLKSEPDPARGASILKNGEDKSGVAVQSGGSHSWGLIGMSITVLGVLVWYLMGKGR